MALRQSTPRSIPKNVNKALSPHFVDEWGPAIDNENAAFAEYKCFHPMPLPARLKSFQVFGFSLESVMDLLMHVFVKVDTVSFWARITFQIRTTVQSF